MYQVFYRFDLTQTANFTGLFGFMGEDKYEFATTVLVENKYDECRAEAVARRKLTNKYRRFMSGLGFPCSIEVGRAVFVGEQG